VRVLDNGVGFDPNVLWRGENHWGIVGMRERARLIGADLQIESQPGEGTTILLRLPLHRDRFEERP
jgi:signal transduction histidine kinase